MGAGVEYKRQLPSYLRNDDAQRRERESEDVEESEGDECDLRR